MIKVQSKPDKYSAIQWQKFGDHPDVLTLSQAEEAGFRRGCFIQATVLYGAAGLFNQGDSWVSVHPGDWVLTSEDGATHVVFQEKFDKYYEIVK